MKLPPNMVVEDTVNGSNGSFHFLHQWKFPYIDIYLRRSFHKLPWKHSWKWVEKENNVVDPVNTYGKHK